MQWRRNSDLVALALFLVGLFVESSVVTCFCHPARVTELPVNRIGRIHTEVFIDSKGGGSDDASKNTGNLPGYQFFRDNGSSYVPSGMTREDYEKIRKRELEKEQNMNYGAWGPRFKRTGVPDGDWMIMPNLWTAGQVKRPIGRGNDQETSDSALRGHVRTLLQILRSNVPSFILAYLLMDCVVLGISMWKWKVEGMTARKALHFILGTVSLQQQVIKLTVVKTELIKVTAAVATVPFINAVIVQLNQWYLWSRRRSILCVLACALGVLGIWRGMLSFIPVP